MRVVLGIDAAWTAHNPSGVALAVDDGAGRWRLVAVVPSYADFYRAADLGDAQVPPGAPSAERLLAAAHCLAGAPVDLVAIDMPLSHEPITGRRASDRAISSAFGSRHAATHSPSASRPGAISDRLRAGFAAAGHPLLTASIATPGLIEVYPHPALIILANADRRLAYKLSRARKYFPSAGPAERRAAIVTEWRRIAALLETKIAGVAELLPPVDAGLPIATLKGHEDALDAIVCAHVAIEALDGRAEPFGDEVSAIWVPRSRSSLRV